MIENFKEAFEKTRVAGSVAAGALNEVSKIIKPGISTNEIDKICYEYTIKREKIQENISAESECG